MTFIFTSQGLKLHLFDKAVAFEVKKQGFLLYLVRNPISLTSKKMCVYLPHFFDFVTPLVAVGYIKYSGVWDKAAYPEGSKI